MGRVRVGRVTVGSGGRPLAGTAPAAGAAAALQHERRSRTVRPPDDECGDDKGAQGARQTQHAWSDARHARRPTGGLDHRSWTAQGRGLGSVRDPVPDPGAAPPAPGRAGAGRLHLRRGGGGARPARARRARPQRDDTGPAAYDGRLAARDADPAVPAPGAGGGVGGPARAAGPGRPARGRGLPGAERRRGRGPPRRAAVRHRRPAPLGGQRPHARPGRRHQPGRRRPRARHQLGVHVAGAAHPARAGRTGPSTSAPAAACRPSTWPGTAARSWPPT